MPEPATFSNGVAITAERVFREHAPRVYQIARRILANDADAQDATQDVMLQVVRKLDQFRGESAFPTWLHRVTVNAALAVRRKKGARHEQSADSFPDQFVADGHRHLVRHWTPEPEKKVLEQERQALIESAIQELPEGYRDVYVLADVEQLPNGEIADMLDMSLPAVKSRLHRARLMMRDRLSPYFEESTP